MASRSRGGLRSSLPRFVQGLIIVLLVGAGGLSGVAHAQSVVDRAKELLRQGKAVDAFELLEPAAEQLNDAESAYLLGIAALDSGKAGLAIMAFERALGYDPNFAPARAELVRALVATGETDQARLELSRLASVPVPPEVRQKLSALEAQLAQAVDLARRRTRGISGYVVAEAGYDSNINTGANSQTFSVPLFGGASVTLDRIFQKHASAFAGLGGGAIAYNEAQPGLRLFAAADVKGRYNFADFDGEHFSTVSWSGNAGLRWQRGAHTATAALTALENTVGGFKFDRQWGVYFQYQRQIDPSNEVGVFGQWLDQRHPILPSLDTRLTVAGIGWSHALGGEGSPVISLTAYYGDDRERGNDPAVGRQILGGRLGFVRRLDIGARLIASFTYQRSDYRAENVFFSRKREDERSDLFLGLAFSPAKDITVTPQFVHTRNRSNVPVVDFAREQVLVTVRRDFY